MYQYKAGSSSVQPRLRGKRLPRKIIAIDFDGVIHDDSSIPAGRKMGVPMVGCKAAMDNLADRGYSLVIWTLRGSDKQHVAEWLDYFDIPYADITDKKPDALLYIDDRAVRHIDWHNTMRDIEMLLPLVEAPPSGE